MNKKFIVPEKINLLGEIYKIKITKHKNMIFKNKIGEHGSTLGTIDLKNKIIYFSDQSNSSQDEIFWHELAHHFFRYYLIPDEEVLCTAFAKFILNINAQLFQAQKENKK